MELSTEIDAKIRRSFASQGLMTTLGASLHQLAHGTVSVAAPILPGSTQQVGLAHGGMIFAIGDAAAGYAALTVLPSDAEVMTAEMKINFIAPGQGDRLIATGRVVKPGRRLVVVTAEVFAEQGGTTKMVALLQGTMVPLVPD